MAEKKLTTMEQLRALVEEFGGLWMTILFVLLLNACLLMYDRALGPIAVLYDKKWRPKLSFLRK